MVPMIINHRSRNLSNDRHIQEAISNRHTSLSQGDIDTNNCFSSAFTCTGTGGWAPTVAAQRINGCAAAGPHASMAQKLRRPAARPASTSSQTSGDAGGRASAAGKVRAAPCRPDRGTRRQGRSSQESLRSGEGEGRSGPRRHAGRGVPCPYGERRTEAAEGLPPPAMAARRPRGALPR